MQTKAIYGVRVTGNFYGGRYYEQGLDVIFVLAEDEYDAGDLARNHIEVVEDMFRNKRYISGKLAIAKKDKRKFSYKDVGSVYKTNSTQFYKVLTENGKFEEVKI